MLSQDLIDSLGDHISTIMSEVRPDAVGLVDALGFDDAILKSTLGRFDGLGGVGPGVDLAHEHGGGEL